MNRCVDDPELAVVIVTYRCDRLLRGCLTSLRAGSELKTEVVVFDNASSSETAAFVREEFPEVVYRMAGANVGFSRANNRAVLLTRAPFVLFLNPDTVVPKGALDVAVAALGQRSDVGLLGCKLVRPDGSLDHACKRGFPTVRNSIMYLLRLDRLSPRLATYRAELHSADESGEVDAINGAFMLARRDAIVDVGPLDERFWMYGEDLDWCLRFWRAGWKVFYLPVAITHVKRGSSGRRRGIRPTVAFHRAMWLFFRKHYLRPATLPTGLAVFLAIHAKLFAALCMNGVYRLGHALARQRAVGEPTTPHQPA